MRDRYDIEQDEEANPAPADCAICERESHDIQIVTVNRFPYPVCGDCMANESKFNEWVGRMNE